MCGGRQAAKQVRSAPAGNEADEMAMRPNATTQGVLADGEIERMIAGGEIRSAVAPRNSQLQPASLDLRLGARGHRLRCSFLPGKGRGVAQQAEAFSQHTFDLGSGQLLEPGGVYLVELQEQLSLPAHVHGLCNPKSSTGRIDVFTRVVTDGSSSFDEIAPGYNGRLYVEIAPRTFPIIVRTGTLLSQIRFRIGNALASDAELKEIHEAKPLVDSEPTFNRGLILHADLTGADSDIVAYRARKHAPAIDVDLNGQLDPSEFWTPIDARQGRGSLILDPGEFYLLASREKIFVPDTLAAELAAFDPLMGEYRVHYAGFFDPGFGSADGMVGSSAVLEVRSRDVPFVLQHGQAIARLSFEKLTGSPKRRYGSMVASNYQNQGLRLGRQFRSWQ